jgi:hypothetical protein
MKRVSSWFSNRIPIRIRRQTEVLLQPAYLMDLFQVEFCTRYLTTPFHIEKTKQKVLPRTNNRLERIYNTILAAVSIWASISCIRFGFRVTGNSSAGSNYSLTQKLVDIGYLTLVMCNLIFKHEFRRKSYELALLLNCSYCLEKRAINRGKGLFY